MAEVNDYHGVLEINMVLWFFMGKSLCTESIYSSSTHHEHRAPPHAPPGNFSLKKTIKPYFMPY